MGTHSLKTAQNGNTLTEILPGRATALNGKSLPTRFFLLQAKHECTCNVAHIHEIKPMYKKS